MSAYQVGLLLTAAYMGGFWMLSLVDDTPFVPPGGRVRWLRIALWPSAIVPIVKKQVVKRLAPAAYADLPDAFWRAYEPCRPYTMVSVERAFAAYEAVRHVVRSGIPGAIVECGVWRGGLAMLAARTLLELGEQRTIYLYDTFEGMPKPDDRDVRVSGGTKALAKWEQQDKWCYASEEEVRKHVLSTGYPECRVVFVRGKVEDTIPAIIPEQIAVLRLDTDWYASTAHEMAHLYPRLVAGGVLLLDDYGYWGGAQQAVEDYFAANGPRPLLARTDNAGRSTIKPTSPAQTMPS